MSCADPTVGQTQLRISGAVALFFSILQVCIDSAAFAQITNIRVGAWWSGVLNVVTASLALSSGNRGVVIATCVFSVLALIVGAIGCIIDVSIAGFLNSLTACIDQSGVITGDDSSSSKYNLMNCIPYGNSCSCVSMDTSNSGLCYYYSGPIVQNDCGNILYRWRHTVSAGAAFDVIAGATVLALSIITCVSLCCPSSLGGAPPVPGVAYIAANAAPTAQAPAVIVVAMPAQPQPQHLQQQQIQYAPAPQAYSVVQYPPNTVVQGQSVDPSLNKGQQQQIVYGTPVGANNF